MSDEAQGSERPNQMLDELRTRPRRSGHSSLYLWLRKHHDEFVDLLKEDRPDWIEFCSVFEKRGLTDRTGKPASVATAQKTWQRVQAEVAKKREREARRQARKQPPPAVQLHKPSPGGQEPETQAKPADTIESFKATLGGRRVNTPDKVK